MKKSFFTICCMTVFVLFSAACSSSDDDGGNTPGGTNPSGGSNTSYIATNAVKTLKIAHEARDGREDIDKMYLIYEDYTYRYYLSLGRGGIVLWPYMRSEGQYVNVHVKDNNYYTAYGIKAFSDIANLQMLTDEQKTEAKERCLYDSYDYWPYYYWFSYATFAPGCGFIAWFKTETEDARYVRIRSTNYTLDENGSLSSISIEYQLF